MKAITDQGGEDNVGSEHRLRSNAIGPTYFPAGSPRNRRPAMAATSLLPSFGSQLLQFGHLGSKGLTERFEALMRKPQETVAEAVLP